jgi:hypothetical protein
MRYLINEPNLRTICPNIYNNLHKHTYGLLSSFFSIANMSPSATEYRSATETSVSKTEKHFKGKNALIIEPLKPTDILDQFKSFDVTPVIGKEFTDVHLVDWLRAPNSDELLRELAITSMFPTSSKPLRMNIE